jgi:hypothetical protein
MSGKMFRVVPWSEKVNAYGTCGRVKDMEWQGRSSYRCVFVLEPELEPEMEPKLEPELEPEMEPELEPELEPEMEPEMELESDSEK